MRLVPLVTIAFLSVAIGSGTALAKGGLPLPKAWTMGAESEVPKGTVTGGDACSKVVAVQHDLDAPYSDPVYHDKPMSGRDRMSGGGQYGEPKELKNWVEFRLRETCDNKKLWAQMWAKTVLTKNYTFAESRTCAGWTMKQNYLTPGPTGNYLSLDVYNYALSPKSVEVRLWDAKDFNGQAKGTGICPK